MQKHLQQRQPWQALTFSNQHLHPRQNGQPMLAPSLQWISTCRAIVRGQELSLASSFPYFSLFHPHFIFLSLSDIRRPHLISISPLNSHRSLSLGYLPTPSRHALSDVVPYQSRNSPTERDIHPSFAPLRHVVAVDAPSLTKYPL